MSDLKKIAEKIKRADAILIGASNGLSITEGLHLFADDQAFRELFGDLKKKYGLTCILHGMSAQWPAEEEKWGFWSRLINHYCGEYKESKVMSDLKAIIGEKDYFVVTSNGECHFEMCGFDPEKIYEIELVDYAVCVRMSSEAVSCAGSCGEDGVRGAGRENPIRAGSSLPGVRRSHEDSYDRAQFYPADSGKGTSGYFPEEISREKPCDPGTGDRMEKPADQSSPYAVDGSRAERSLYNDQSRRSVHYGRY
jgi:hypothetical protein